MCVPSHRAGNSDESYPLTRLLPHISPGCSPSISPGSINPSLSLCLWLSVSLCPSVPPLSSPLWCMDGQYVESRKPCQVSSQSLATLLFVRGSLRELELSGFTRLAGHVCLLVAGVKGMPTVQLLGDAGGWTQDLFIQWARYQLSSRKQKLPDSGIYLLSIDL